MALVNWREVGPSFAEPYLLPLIVQTPVAPPSRLGIAPPEPVDGAVAPPPLLLPLPALGAVEPAPGVGAVTPPAVGSYTADDVAPGVKVPSCDGHMALVNATSRPAAFALP
jgi:hypothetical protein